MLKLISFTSFVYICKEFVDSKIERCLSSICKSLLGWIGEQIIDVLFSIFYSLFLVIFWFIVVLPWAWLLDWIHLNMLLMLVTILIIDCHWYLSQTSKFIDVILSHEFTTNKRHPIKCCLHNQAKIWCPWPNLASYQSGKLDNLNKKHRYNFLSLTINKYNKDMVEVS